MSRTESHSPRADGSSTEDRRRIIRIDRTDPIQRMRWRCPNNHTTWEPTNSHAYCASCARHVGLDPEHYELLDARTGERVSWARIELE
ncbi:hypothetical protein [Halalkalicoccus sp. NIPERK01]|uniref:hypothetical protein n=1 Tax=Halalkalicoccus sp. NIPERK01 TaxID=3053469 RepID=UPI00256EC143|nr:hypothetical protein [Halalkalicoccus sp. NIPERK01]MDL5361321.1 hypothetical protein [Halalkalicoccus sp. NIPERK01]